ncbi:restriction endonuclease [Pseudaminobacter sp. 19-2017]|uniref:site-specific DNA-methyltransferase (adenine-specific) n=1 Tax=Pseudaminobacter soli (ex Zhang et al. 2022) TaxID=2831468 RepID=A0A942DZU0_9HYPH|nr:DNA methyltransferase [Pseudaminobacter soli]MBS3648548.1 restriction endonuclease [Pseudaminobacter soli]
MNKLFFGDNLDVLREHIKDESVDLIYLDPPFNSKANYGVIFSDKSGVMSEAQAEAFKDTWTWGETSAHAYQDLIGMRSELSVLMEAFRKWLGTGGTLAYLSMMAVRLVELKRVLKETGSIYLHCDPTASHYLKIIMDAIFGHRNFRNEVIWDYSFRLMDLPRFFNRKHDVILFYAASDRSFFNMPKTEWTREDLMRSRKQKIHVDDEGVEWIWMPGGRGNSKSRLRRVDEIIAGGKAVSDVWPIPIISSSSRERVGYPTQKPLALLDRIISASSKEDAVVLDPFCGCGTTIEASERLRRNWLGIDITHYAITVIQNRLERRRPDAKFSIYGRPTDLAGAIALAERDKYQFQWWAAWKLGAQTYESKKGGDKGVDGNIYFANGPYGLGRIIISVKGGHHVNPSMVRDLAGTVERENAEMGVLVTLNEPTRGMISDAANYGFVSKTPHGRLPRVQIVTAADLIDGRLPNFPPIPISQSAARPRKRDKDQLELMLPFAGSQSLRTGTGDMIDPRFLSFA